MGRRARPRSRGRLIWQRHQHLQCVTVTQTQNRLGCLAAIGQRPHSQRVPRSTIKAHKLLVDVLAYLLINLNEILIDRRRHLAFLTAVHQPTTCPLQPAQLVRCQHHAGRPERHCSCRSVQTHQTAFGIANIDIAYRRCLRNRIRDRWLSTSRSGGRRRIKNRSPS